MQQKMHLQDCTKIELFLDLAKELKNFNQKENQYTIPIFIPHQGCKNACVFCNQKKISGTTHQVTPQKVEKFIEEYLEYFKERKTKKKIEVAFFGGSFTGLPVKEQIDYLEIANRYLDSGRIDGIRLSTRPDYISVPILKIMKKYHVTTIELGIQSMDPEVLLLSKRGHTKEDVIRASRLIKLFGIELGHQIMVGLPGSTIEKEIKTIYEVLRERPSQLRIYPVYVIEPSELYDMYLQNKYQPLEFQEAVERCYQIILACKKTDVKIIRLGLQSTSEITMKNTHLIGPVCDNFAEYVMAKMIRDVIEEKIKDSDFGNKNIQLDIKIPKKYISVVIGPKKINKIYFEEKYSKNHLKLKVKEIDV